MSVKRSVRLFTEYDPPVDPGIDCSVMPSMTQQNFRDECDINNIMARYLETGFIDLDSSMKNGQYLDLPSGVDYHVAQNLVIAANAAFMDLPPNVRARFNNDPQQFLLFVDDPSNREEAFRLGLLRAVNEPSTGDAKSPLQASVAAPVGGSEGSSVVSGGGSKGA